MDEEKKIVKPLDDNELENITGGANGGKTPNKKYYKCPQCPEIYPSKAKLKAHINALHK